MPTRRSRVQSEDEEENFDPNMEEDQEEVNSDTEVTAAATARPKRGQKAKETNNPKAFVASDSRPGRKRVLIAEGKLIGQHSQFRPCCNHFLEDSVLDPSSSPSLVKLRHPGTGQAALFLVDSEVKVIKEVTTYKEDNRSWFVDEVIESDGKVFLATSFDPLLILLPFLSDPEAKLTPLDQLVEDAEFPAVKKIAGSPEMTKRLSKIADSKGSDAFSPRIVLISYALVWFQDLRI